LIYIYILFVVDGAVVGDGRDPGLSRDESNLGAIAIAEDDLGGSGGLFPGAEDNVAVLEDVGVAGADVGDVFVVVVVGGTLLLDNHSNDDFGGELEVLAIVLRGTGKDVVGVAGFIRAVVRVGFGVVVEDGVEVGDVAKAEIDMGDLSGESVGVAGGGLINLELMDDLTFGTVESGGVGGEMGETMDVGREIAARGIVLGEERAGGKEVVPHTI